MLPQLIPLIGLLTQEVVPSGLVGGVGVGRGKEVRSPREETGGREAGISSGRKEEPRNSQDLRERWDPMGLEER